MPRINAPLTSFGADLQAVLREGAARNIRITFPVKNLAVRFNQRINALRKAMKDAKHPDWEQLYRCSIYSDPNDPCTLTIGPRDHEFHEILVAAGVNLAPPPPMTEVTITEGTPGETSVDAFMTDLIAQTSVQGVLTEIEEEGPEPDVNSL